MEEVGKRAAAGSGDGQVDDPPGQSHHVEGRRDGEVLEVDLRAFDRAGTAQPEAAHRPGHRRLHTSSPCIERGEGRSLLPTARRFQRFVLALRAQGHQAAARTHCATGAGLAAARTSR